MTPKAFAVLSYLVERPGRLVTKEELFRVIWPKTVVSDTALAVCIREIRRVLADTTKAPQFIETVHRRGYRWIAPLTTTAPAQRGGWSVKREASPPAPIALRSSLSAPRLVGREAELAQLHNWLEKALAGERQIVFVTGEPGIGKTSVVEAFLEHLATEGNVQIGRGQCIEHYGAGEGYMPVLEALGRLCRESGGKHLIALLNQHAPTWLVQMPALLESADLEALQRKVQGASRERMLREMGEALEVLTAEQPLVLRLEDLHWSDYSTLELLSVLARRRERARLLVIGTYRPMEMLADGHPLRTVKQELQLHRQCEEQRLALLTEEHVAEYLTMRFSAQTTGWSSLQGLARLIHQRTEGNPLFMVNVVDYLTAQGGLGKSGEKVQNRVPGDLRQMIEEQIHRLSPEEQNTLEVASVAGAEFSAAAVAAGAGAQVSEVEIRCAGLARREQFLQARGMEEWPDGTVAARYSFLHALYQQVLYERVTAGRRIELHRRIGERQERAYGEGAREIAAALAVHFEQGREYSRAVQYRLQAGQKASQRLASKEAIAHLNQGIEILGMLPPSPERDGKELDLRARLGMAWLGFKGWTAPEMWTSLHPALGLAKSPSHYDALLTVYQGLSEYVLIRGRAAEALNWVNEMLATAEASGNPELLIMAHWMAGIVRFWRGDVAQSRAHDDRVLALYDEEQHRHLVDLINTAPTSDVGVHGSLGAWMQGYLGRAMQLCAANDAHSRRRGHPIDLGWMLIGGCLMWDCRREPVPLLARVEEAERLGRAYSLPFISDVLAQIMKGIAWLRAGRLAEGIPQLQSAVETWSTQGGQLWMPYFRAVLAEGLVLSGDLEGGLSLIEESLAQIARPGWGERWYLAEILRLKGWMLSLQGDLVGAEQSYLASLDWAHEQQAKSWELRTTTSLARLWQQQGKKTEAHQMLAEIYGWFTEGFDTRDLQEAKALLETMS